MLFVLSDRQLRMFTPAGKPSTVLRLPPDTIGTGLALVAAGEEFVEGSTWTTPTPNRATASEVAAYRAEGVRTVEMEAAALFAVGEARSVEVASAVVVSDEVTPDGMPSDYMNALPRLLRLLEIVLETAAD